MLRYFFRKKKEDGQPKSHDPDKQVHRIFQIAALFVIGYIFYTMYFVEDKKPVAVGADLTQEELNEKAKQAFENMKQDPEYRMIREFVTNVESKADKEKGNILNTNDGILIYVPGKLLHGTKPEIVIENEELKLKLNHELKNAAAGSEPVSK